MSPALLKASGVHARSPAARAFALALAVTLAATTVRAQDESPAAAPQTSEAGGEASTRFRRGLMLFEESEYALALIEFERAYELSPNFRALYNIGLVNVQLGRYASATRALERYLADGRDEVPPARRQEVDKLLADLVLRTANVTIESNVDGTLVTLDGKALGSTPFAEPLLVDAGEHTIVASAPRAEPKTYTLTLAGQDKTSLVIELVQQAEEAPVEAQAAPPRHRLFWPGFVAAGVLGAGAATAFAIMMKSRGDLADLRDEPGSSAKERADAADRAQVSAITADVLTGLTVVTAGVSLYLSLRPERKTTAPKVVISPSSVSLRGRF